MKEKYKQQLSTAAREILEHSGLSFALMGGKMAVSPREKAVKLVKAHPAEVQEIKAALLAEKAEERETTVRRHNFRSAIPKSLRWQKPSKRPTAKRSRGLWIAATASIPPSPRAIRQN